MRGGHDVRRRASSPASAPGGRTRCRDCPSACAVAPAIRPGSPRRCRAVSRAARLPADSPRKISHAPAGVSSFSRAATATPQPSAKASAARVGLPAGIDTRPSAGGPRFSMRCAGLFELVRQAPAPRAVAAWRRTAPVRCRGRRRRSAGATPSAKAVSSSRNAFGRQLFGADLNEEVSRTPASGVSPFRADCVRRPGGRRCPSGNRGPRGCRSRPAPPGARARARAGCSAAAR